jgi:hypothetical protein
MMGPMTVGESGETGRVLQSIVPHSALSPGHKPRRTREMEPVEQLSGLIFEVSWNGWT